MPNKKEILPEISILIPTYNRSKFLKLCLMNLKNQIYPHELLTVIIDDDGSEKFIKDNEMENIKNFIHPIKLKYLYSDKKRSIGAKRNNLVKQANTKIVSFFDDDDVYLPTAITHTYETMIRNKKSCAGSDKMIFCMTDKDFSVHMIDCGNTVKLIHEGGCLMFTKKFFRASCGFENSSQGEGKNLFFGMENCCAITDITKVMLCIQHSGNTVPKLQFYKDNNKLNIELSEEMKNLLKEILEI